MLNIYYHPIDYQVIRDGAVLMDSIEDADAFEQVWCANPRPCTIINRIPALVDCETLLDHLPNFRKHIKELAKSPHEINLYMAMRRGGLQQQPCISTVRLLANKISM